jgi:hypothetical protein
MDEQIQLRRKLYEVVVLVREYDGDTKDVVQTGNIFKSSSMAHVAHDRAMAAIREVYQNSNSPVRTPEATHDTAS